ncbi:MAG: cell filamentation protein Fic [Firmicutes bacterium CAG:321_26_22]|nr:MAG: cell filamentation protein Fic [Firmicutes bacterium CAG:321_26_22]
MNNKVIGNEKNIIFYNDGEGNTKIEVLLQDEDVWLNTEALAILFNVKRPAITKHINNIYNDGELSENSTCSKMEHMGNDGKQSYNTKYYNLDMIISIGFRVNSKKAIKFRTWANKIIKDYIIQGFALNDDRFMKVRKSDQEYFNRLLERIKLIRTSERMFYQKITDIFSECSIDYDRNSETASTFYKIIQNKFHYAITGKTAAEIVYDRADAKKKNMGLTTWEKSPDGKILKSDIIIAKNYLAEKEIKGLNNLVNLFLDIAENNAERNIPMYMNDWKNEVENALKVFHYEALEGKENISHKQAIQKATGEYEKYRVIQDKNYISDFDKLVKETEQLEK